MQFATFDPEWYRLGFAGVAILAGMCLAYGSAARRYAPAEASAPRWVYKRSFGAAAGPAALIRINRAYRARYDAERRAYLPEIIASALIFLVGTLSLWTALPLAVSVASSVVVLATGSFVSYALRRAAPRRRVAVLQGRGRTSVWEFIVFAATSYCALLVAAAPQLDLSVRIAAPLAVVALVLAGWWTRTGSAVLAGEDMDAAAIVDRHLRLERSQGLLIGALAVAGAALLFGGAGANARLLPQAFVWQALRDVVPMAIVIYYVPRFALKPANVELSTLE